MFYRNNPFPLHKAIKNSDLTHLKLLLEKKIYTNAFDEQFLTPFDLVKILLRWDSHSKSEDLFLKKIYPLIKKENALTGEELKAQIFVAAEKLELYQLEKLLFNNALGTKIKTPYGETPLLKAVRSTGKSTSSNCLDVIKFLIKKGKEISQDGGVNVASKYLNGWPILFEAIKQKNIKVVELLIKNGADLHQKNGRNQGALTFAKAQNSTEIIYLIESFINLPPLSLWPTKNLLFGNFFLKSTEISPLLVTSNITTSSLSPNSYPTLRLIMNLLKLYTSLKKDVSEETRPSFFSTSNFTNYSNIDVEAEKFAESLTKNNLPSYLN